MLGVLLGLLVVGESLGAEVGLVVGLLVTGEELGI